MHENRTKYSYEEYQDIIRKRWFNTVFWLAKEKEKPGTYSLYFAKPTPRTAWLPGKPRSKYYRRIKNKLTTQFRDSKKKYTFLTLTYDQNTNSKAFCFNMLKSNIREFIRLLRKRYKKIQYFWIIELTKNGYPHIHIIFDRYAHWKIINAIWRGVTDSYITYIKQIPSSAVAGYLTKYLTRQSKHTEYQFAIIFKNVDRLYGNSRDFFSIKVIKTDSGWLLISLSLDCYFNDFELLRPDPDCQFWELPSHYASMFIKTDDILDHIDWSCEFPDVYSYFIRLHDYKDIYRFKNTYLNYDGIDPDSLSMSEVPF